jgi:membrane-associated protease RseP (regulator of RpoE activity)
MSRLMSGWLIATLFVVSILVVVLIHEAGHFLTAKAFGIKVEEFFVGFGPRLWSTRKGETEYGFKALPFGGYVRIAGMNPFQETPPAELPRTFGAKPAWQRAVVIITGPVTHFVMAVVFLAVYFSAIGLPRFQPVIGGVEPTLNGEPSPAAEAGFEPGDRIVAVDGRPIGSTDEFIAITRSRVGQEIAITVERDGRRLTLRAAPVLSEIEGESAGRLGVVLGDGEIVGRDRTDPFTGLGRGVLVTGTITKAVVLRLGDVFGPAGLRRIGELLVGQEPRTAEDVVSVVGGVRLAAEAGQAGAWDALFQLFVLFNIFVGILNLVPLPPLDGGHLAVIAVEKVIGRKVDARKLVPITALVAGFMILFALSVVYLDIVKPVPNPFR